MCAQFRDALRKTLRTGERLSEEPELGVSSLTIGRPDRFFSSWFLAYL